jgi:MoaA/NifB/PqqE/SkfB family radical SAM enzyme
MMELEIENTCNLECVMCIGELSSAIRKNRDKLPPIKSPYNEAFVEQLEEFIPHLKELRFNGGEPFLINSVFRIFEKWRN